MKERKIDSLSREFEFLDNSTGVWSVKNASKKNTMEERQKRMGVKKNQ